MRELIGQTIGGYQVTRLIGRGGMGAVYMAEHPVLQRRVAIKVLLADMAAKPKVVERFIAEAKAVNLIRHPNIVDISDINRLPDGSAYLVMEYLEGQSLKSYLVQMGLLTLKEAAGIALQIADALGAAHARSIVHRDLKPDNVYLLRQEGDTPFVKLLDFGIAKLSSSGSTDGTSDLHTQTGVVVGTPTYMSPEQAMGKNKEIDGRTDGYALGVILFQMLAGHVPFEAEAFGELMLKHLYEPVPPVCPLRPDLPPEIDAFLFRAMGKKKEDRFPSMQSFAQELVRLCTLSGVSATLPVIATPHSLAPVAPDLRPRPTPAPPENRSNPGTVLLPQSAQRSAPSQPSWTGPAPSTPTTMQTGAGEVHAARRRASAVALAAVGLVAGIAIAALVTAGRWDRHASPAAPAVRIVPGPAAVPAQATAAKMPVPSSAPVAPPAATPAPARPAATVASGSPAHAAPARDLHGHEGSRHEPAPVVPAHGAPSEHAAHPATNQHPAAPPVLNEKPAPLDF